MTGILTGRRRADKRETMAAGRWRSDQGDTMAPLGPHADLKYILCGKAQQRVRWLDMLRDSTGRIDRRHGSHTIENELVPGGQASRATTELRAAGFRGLRGVHDGRLGQRVLRGVRGRSRPSAVPGLQADRILRTPHRSDRTTLSAVPVLRFHPNGRPAPRGWRPPRHRTSGGSRPTSSRISAHSAVSALRSLRRPCYDRSMTRSIHGGGSRRVGRATTTSGSGRTGR